MNWYLDVLKKYAEFNGRASRQEFWMFFLINLLISFGIQSIAYVTGLTLIQMVGSLYGLAVLVPSIAVGVRRLHDTGRPGIYLLLWFVVCIGWILLIIWYVEDSKPGDNQYGPNPKGM